MIAGDGGNYQSLIRAAEGGDAEAVRSLLAQGADVNASTVGRQTALMRAAFFGHRDVVRVLLDEGADVHARDRLGLTATEWSQRRGYLEIAQLIEGVEEVDGREPVMNEAGRRGVATVDTPEPPAGAWGAELDQSNIIRPIIEQVATPVFEESRTAAPLPRERHKAPPPSQAVQPEADVSLFAWILGAALLGVLFGHIITVVLWEQTPGTLTAEQIVTEAESRPAREAAINEAAGQSPPAPVAAVLKPAPKAPAFGEVLNAQAVRLPQPTYPAKAKRAGASGSVSVQVVVDEKGKVESARAVSGHPLLQEAAVAAARRAEFPPKKVGRKAVKVTGVITHSFAAEEEKKKDRRSGRSR
ncbi:MAG: TonB family protein [Acidobacteriota bacterium]|nr:TonB family protein [Acidobacteriota bacterium]